MIVPNGTWLTGCRPLHRSVYIELDIDKTASALAAIMVVGQVMNNLTEYLVPWVLERSQRVSASDALLEDEEDEEEGGGGKGLLVKKHAEDQALTGKLSDDPQSISARKEIVSRDVYVTVELTEMVVQFGYVALFGFVWPLTALAVFINNFLEVRFDVWKFCEQSRRPIAQRARGLGAFWGTAVESVAVLGIVNTSLILAFSTNTMDEYFFPGIDVYQRATAALATMVVFLLVYALVRLVYLNVLPKWIVASKKEPLRFIRDAYRAGCALRERRYKLLQTAKNPAKVTLAAVAKTEGMEEPFAERYLTLVRYIDSQAPQEKAALLLDSATTITSLLTAVLLKKRNHAWPDRGEAPSATSLLRAIMPVMDLKEAYKLGKLFREASYAIWDFQRSANVLGSKAATIMYIRQFAAIEVGITLPQAERYCRLVRMVDAMEGNPFDRLFDLSVEHPGGLVEVLSVRGEGIDAAEAGEEGEPAPSELGPYVEPTTMAKRAFMRADYVRRRMYEQWMHDNYLQHQEMIELVSEEMGLMPTQLQRYLLVKRYCDSLPDGKVNELLEMAGTETLYLVGQIRQMVAQGLWLDAGEPDFAAYVPPIVHDS